MHLLAEGVTDVTHFFVIGVTRARTRNGPMKSSVTSVTGQTFGRVMLTG